MPDNRTPAQLAKVSAHRLFDTHPLLSPPTVFLCSQSYENFVAGRKFNQTQQKEFQDAYQAEYKKLSKAV